MKNENGTEPCPSPLNSPDTPKTPAWRFERLRFLARDETPLSAQSPTTALAKLNFNRDPPSPDVQQVVNFPTTSLDKLNFTPCFAREENAKRTLAVKRPLSTSIVENVPEPEPEKPVTLRSPEVRAKRPLVRPNSIAFSRYPSYDLSSEPPNRLLSPETKDDSMPEKPAPLQVTKRACSQTDMTGRKSRSLDDILASSDDDSPKSCECPNKRLNEILTANCTSSSNSKLDPCRCTDPHQSNSSISSTGSRGSLQGSLEMIPVS